MIFLYSYLGIGVIILIMMILTGHYFKVADEIYSSIINEQDSDSDYILANIISHLILIFNVLCLWILFLLSIKYVNNFGGKR